MCKEPLDIFVTNWLFAFSLGADQLFYLIINYMTLLSFHGTDSAKAVFAAEFKCANSLSFFQGVKDCLCLWDWLIADQDLVTVADGAIVI